MGNCRWKPTYFPGSDRQIGWVCDVHEERGHWERYGVTWTKLSPAPGTLPAAGLQARAALRRLVREAVQSWPVSAGIRWGLRLGGLCAATRHHPYTGELAWCVRDRGHVEWHRGPLLVAGTTAHWPDRRPPPPRESGPPDALRWCLPEMLES